MNKETKKRLDQKLLEEEQQGKRDPYEDEIDKPEWDEELGKESDDQKQFKKDMEAAGYEVRLYRGRYFYRGYAAEVPKDKLQDAIRATYVEVQWDNLGLDYILYPRD